jgi:hypothetical protein
MTKYVKVIMLMTMLFIVGCAAGTSNIKSYSALPPTPNINCATINQMTDAEWQYCMSGGNSN